MEQKRISMGQRIGYFFLALLPFILFIAIQLLAMVVFELVAMIQTIYMYATAGMLSETALHEIATNIDNAIPNYLIEINVIYQLIALAIFGVWYYFMVTYRKKVQTDKAMGLQACIGIPLMGIGVEIVTSLVVGIFALIFPKVIQDYMDLMEETGLNEITPIVLIATIVFAPLVEELIFRGIILYYASKMTKHFWIANVFQALLFGIGHMNLVQGVYAFVLGTIMGCVYYKYRSIKATILLHAAFNFVGSVISTMLELIPEENAYQLLALEFMMVVCGIIGLVLVLTDHKKKALYS